MATAVPAVATPAHAPVVQPLPASAPELPAPLEATVAAVAGAAAVADTAAAAEGVGQCPERDTESVGADAQEPTPSEPLAGCSKRPGQEESVAVSKRLRRKTPAVGGVPLLTAPLDAVPPVPPAAVVAGEPRLAGESVAVATEERRHLRCEQGRPLSAHFTSPACVAAKGGGGGVGGAATVAVRLRTKTNLQRGAVADERLAGEEELLPSVDASLAELGAVSSGKSELDVVDMMSGASKGLCATLGGLSPDAKLEELQARYRESAVRAHPDEGGSKDELAEVVRAFEALERIMSVRRPRQVVSPAMWGRPGNISPCGEQGVSVERPRLGEGRATAERLLREAPAGWPATLLEVELGTLKAMRDPLREMRAWTLQETASVASRIGLPEGWQAVPTPIGRGRPSIRFVSPQGREFRSLGAAIRSHAQMQGLDKVEVWQRYRASLTEAGPSDMSLPGMLRMSMVNRGLVYRVVAHVNSLIIATRRTPSFKQAVEWHIAMASLRSVAVARHHLRSKGSSSDTSDPDEGEYEPPVTQAEFLQCVRDAPDISLTFHTQKRCKFQAQLCEFRTPKCDDLELACAWHRRLRDFVKDQAASRDDFTQQVLEMWSEGAARSKALSELRSRLREAVVSELRRRCMLDVMHDSTEPLQSKEAAPPRRRPGRPPSLLKQLVRRRPGPRPRRVAASTGRPPGASEARATKGPAPAAPRTAAPRRDDAKRRQGRPVAPPKEGGVPAKRRRCLAVGSPARPRVRRPGEGAPSRCKPSAPQGGAPRKPGETGDAAPDREVEATAGGLQAVVRPGSLAEKEERPAAPWLPGLSLGTAGLEMLSFEDLYRLRLASRPACAAAEPELWARCHDFRYEAAAFEVHRPPTRSGRGRLPTGGSSAAAAEVAGRLRHLLSRPRHRERFAQLDLGQAPARALEDAALQALLGCLPHLELVLVPYEGWSTPSERRAFCRAAPEGTRVMWVLKGGATIDGAASERGR